MPIIKSGLHAGAICCLLISVLLAPWLFGAVQPWAQLLCLLFAVGASVCAIAFCVLNQGRATAVGPGWSLVALAAVGLLQLKTLGSWSIGIVSPNATGLRSQFGLQLEHTELSLVPSATRDSMAVLLTAILIFLVAVKCIRGWMLRPLLLALAASGASLSCIALWQWNFADNLMYGFIDSGVASAIGPFVNRNNAAGYLLATLAASLGGWLLSRASTSRIRIPESWHARHRWHLSELASVNPTTFLSSIFAVLITSGILLTQSRGGILALVLGVSTTFFLVMKRQHFRAAAAAMLVVAGLAIGMLAAFDNWTPASERIATISDEKVLAKDGRLEVWKGAVMLFGDFWVVGAGLGTFQSVFPIYDPSPSGTIATHAENGLIQIACECGVIGLAAVLAGLWFLATLVIRMLSDATSRTRALGTMGLFLIVSQVIASIFDFGLSIPANIFICTLLAGILVASPITSVDAKSHRAAQVVPSSNSAGWRAAVFNLTTSRNFETLTCGVLVLTFYSALNLARASSVETLPPSVSQAHSTNHFERERLERNIAARWDDGLAHFRIAELYIAEYEQLASAVAPNWSVINNVGKLGEALTILEQGEAAATDVRVLRELPLVKQKLEPALHHLYAARSANCLLPNVHLRLFHLSPLETSSSGDRSEHLARYVRLMEGERFEDFATGMVLFEKGEYKRAFACWKPCLENKSRYRAQIIQHAKRVATASQLLQELYPQTEWFLMELLDTHYAGHEDIEQRSQVVAALSALGSTR